MNATEPVAARGGTVAAWSVVVGWLFVIAGLIGMAFAIEFVLNPPVARGFEIPSNPFWLRVLLRSGGVYIAALGATILAWAKGARLETTVATIGAAILGWLLVAPAGAFFSCGGGPRDEPCERTHWYNGLNWRLPGHPLIGALLGIAVVGISAFILIRACRAPSRTESLTA